MDLTQSLRFRLVQFYLWAPEDRRRRWPVLAESWDWFCLRYGSLIARCARRLSLPDRDDREDELWLHLIPRLRDLNYDANRGSLDTCIEFLVLHAVSDASRAARAQRQEPSAEELPAELVGCGDDPHAALEAREDCRAVRDAINAMRHRGAGEDAWLLERYWFEDATLAAVAAELGRPSAQVRSQHRQARKRLRAELRRRGWHDLPPGRPGASAPSGNS